MFNPSGITLGEISSTVRDFSVVIGIVVFSWKARGAYQSVTDFVERITQHMTIMEDFAKTAIENHLTHLEQDIRTLANRHREESED